MLDSASYTRLNVYLHWAGLFAIAGLVVMGTAISIFTLAAFAVASFQIIFGDEDFSWQMMFILFPFAAIFKMSPGSTSLFTYIILLFVITQFLKSRTLPSIWLYLAIYLVAIPVLTMRLYAFSILRWIKLLFGLLMVYYYFDRREYHDDGKVFIAFACGMIASSLSFYLESDFFRVMRYIDEINTVADVGAEYRDLVRFAGLSNDPNYYAANLIISMCSLIVLLYQKRISIKLFSLLIAPLMFFNISTYSKSAMLLLVIPISLIIYVVRKTRRRDLYWLLVGMTVTVVFFITVGGGGDFIHVILTRFGSSSGESMDLNRMTTGRVDRWLEYLEYFKDHPGWFLIGRGLNESPLRNRDVHNAYIESIYYLGAIGTSLFLCMLKQILNTIPAPPKRNILNNCILLSTLLAYIFLNILLYYDLPFHIILIFAVLTMNLEQPDSWLLQNRKRVLHEYRSHNSPY